MLGLRFMLENSSTITFFLDDKEAKEIFNNWKTGYYDLKGARVIEGKNPNSSEWAVLAKTICGMDTVILTPEQISEIQRSTPNPNAPRPYDPNSPYLFGRS
jgi:hypothetical protein